MSEQNCPTCGARCKIMPGLPDIPGACPSDAGTLHLEPIAEAELAGVKREYDAELIRLRAVIECTAEDLEAGASLREGIERDARLSMAAQLLSALKEKTCKQ